MTEGATEFRVFHCPDIERPKSQYGKDSYNSQKYNPGYDTRQNKQGLMFSISTSLWKV
jgi:hypothetical protein